MNGRLVAAAVLAVAGAGLVGEGLLAQRAAPVPAASVPVAVPASAPPATSASRHPADAPTRTAAATRPPSVRAVGLPRSVPVEVRIPSIGVRSGLAHLQRASDGTVEVPKAYDQAGWYVRGATPGQRGSAVILGHVDSTAGPAVFYRLGALRPGREIDVRRSDGRTAVFTVEAVAQYPKDQFPTYDIYGATTYPSLRLVTCGGSFNRSSGHYRDNIVVYAALSGVRPAVG